MCGSDVMYRRLYNQTLFSSVVVGFAEILRRPWLLLIVAIIGCDCACDTLPCPRTSEGVEISGVRIEWNGVTLTDEENPSAEICIEYTPGDMPSDLSPGAIAEHFGLIARGPSVEQDEYYIGFL